MLLGLETVSVLEYELLSPHLRERFLKILGEHSQNKANSKLHQVCKF